MENFAKPSNLENLEIRPSEIGQLTKLKSLSLGRNQFSGVIPDSISSLVKLVELILAQNLFVGSVLDSINHRTCKSQVSVLGTQRVLPSIAGGNWRFNFSRSVGSADETVIPFRWENENESGSLCSTDSETDEEGVSESGVK
ncbi:hypothetical protein CcCBS67573_g10426 [Chytriomyces confervae]|uniref:Uncharacterized protein n=1 Tax=Chytriomyces confervae TaxID=246404 RepID=A0A507CY89_9FUNG|nr:hypothetical protein CcCBS67573_g10426 [Chytriomyces confervae]